MQTDKDSYIEQETQKIVKFWLSAGLIGGAGVFILLSLLDYVVTPENFVRFLYYRIGAAFLLIVLHLFNRKVTNKLFRDVLIILTVIIASSAVEVMILSFGGHQSIYYAGMIITVVFILGFTSAAFKIAVVAVSIVNFVYFFPILFFDNITNIPIFVSNTVFLFAVSSVSLVWSFLRENGLRNQISLQYDLAEGKNKLQEYSGNLEELVVKRTMELSASEQRHRELFENANDGIAVIDKNGIIVDVNKRFCDVHGFGKNVLAGTHFGILEVKDNEGEKEERMRRIQSGESFVYEAAHYKRDGSTILFEVSSKAMNIGGGVYIKSFFKNHNY